MLQEGLVAGGQDLNLRLSGYEYEGLCVIGVGVCALASPSY
ncbi:hypothetical protein MPC1_6700003 [Methylocella tundrae]|nr:hypothetical protein MPC1_6700003 [Methylocella tundrae]